MCGYSSLVGMWLVVYMCFFGVGIGVKSDRKTMAPMAPHRLGLHKIEKLSNWT